MHVNDDYVMKKKHSIWTLYSLSEITWPRWRIYAKDPIIIDSENELSSVCRRNIV